MIQTIIVTFIVTLAIAYVAYKIYKRIQSLERSLCRVFRM